MKIIKKIVKFLVIFLLVIIVTLFAAPFLFKGKIMAIAKEQINKNLNAKVDFKDVDISFFRRFPRVAVALENLHVTGIDQFAADTLIAAKDIDVAVNFMSIIKGSDMKIYSVTLDEPRIHAIMAKDGKANWDIVKPDTATVATPAEEAKPFKMELKNYAIKNGYINYKDEVSNMSSEIINLNHEGSGDFTADLFTLQTKTTTDAVSFNYGGVPYLANTKTLVDLDLEIDNKTNKYSFKTDKIQLNNLLLSTAGFFQLVNDSVYNMDISFNAPSNDFKNILSLIPAVYQKDFNNIKTSGSAAFNGFVKGTYSNTQIPAYSVNLDVKNGFFQYPDLPKPVKNINLTVKVNNPDGIADHTVVDIPNGHIEMDNDPFDFRLLLKNPVSDMYIDAAAKGKLDLSKVAQYVKLEAGTKLGGLLNADVSAKGNVSTIEKQQYEKFNAAGTIGVTNFNYASKEYPDPVVVHNLLMSFNPKNVTISDFNGQYKQTNFFANGSVNNLLAYVLKNQALSGFLNVQAYKLNLDDWMGTTSADSAAAAKTTTTTAASDPFAVPANLDIVVNSVIGKVHYDKLDISNLSGSLSLKNETVFINNVKGEALDGTMLINGSYSTAVSKKKPDISLSYDVKGLDVQKTFYAFNTVQKLMPVGKFIDGKLSSQLKMNGKLGEDMMPDLTSLTGNGNLLLIEGFLRKFAPLEKLASVLSVKELEGISLKDVKNYFEFTDGKVLIKPFNVKVKDIAMEIGGMHGFDQSLEYLINLKVPRALMGDKGNAFVNNLVTQVNNKGIPVKIGETVNLAVKMGGTITSPTIKTDLKEAAGNMAEQLKQQAVDFAKAKFDSTKTAVTNAAKDSINSAKKQVMKGLEDELAKQLSGKKDSGTTTNDKKKQLEETGKGLINNLFKKKKPATDTTKKQ